MKRPFALLMPVMFAACADQAPTAPSFAREGPSLAANVQSGDNEFTFTTIAVPGATTTIAWGINARGEIVGEYLDAAARRHGFLLRNGVFTPIDFPGALGTSARGINPGGDIVGIYRNRIEPTTVPAHGFLLTRQGDFLTADFPGHLNTIPQRILPDGTILGCRHDYDTMGSMRGIAMGHDGNSEIDAFASMNNGATPDRRRIVGLWTNMMTGRGEGYIIEDGEFRSFTVPGSTRTAGWDINPAGEIVGVYVNATGTHGFVRLGDDGAYVSVDFPGATVTQAFGINARGDVVGSYAQAGKTLGFLARRSR